MQDKDKTNMTNIMDFLTEVQETGLRDLTEDQQKMLDDHNVELVIFRNTAQDFYCILPSEQDILRQIDDESLNGIVAAKAATAGTVGSLGSASTVSSIPVCYFSIGSAGTYLGTVGTASSGRDIDDATTQLRSAVYDDLKAGGIPMKDSDGK